MKCVACRIDYDLTPEGSFPIHRVPGKDRFTFCDGSGEPGYIAAINAAEVA